MLRRSDDDSIIEFDIDDTLSLHQPESERVVVLNETARALWRLLEEPAPLQHLVDELALVYGVEPAHIRVDVRTAVDTLLAEGLLQATR